MSLQSRFLSQLDMLSDKFLRVFKKRGGQMGGRLQTIMEPMAQDDDVDIGRECIIKGLCVYLNEDPDNLVKEYVTADEAFIQKSNETTTVGIYVLKFHDGSQDIGIVLEGQNVLQGLDNFALATAMLFGLMYALNLNYPPEMKYTFEVLQKEVMELEGCTLSKKAQVLRNRLYE